MLFCNVLHLLTISCVGRGKKLYVCVQMHRSDLVYVHSMCGLCTCVQLHVFVYI